MYARACTVLPGSAGTLKFGEEEERADVCELQPGEGGEEGGPVQQGQCGGWRGRGGELAEEVRHAHAL
ncbi:hypothetical protein CVT25_012016 [Psilocybe cyanescens]|uniref:Uncharacterized protein n=1 Tax=Psilocybe cyanescens TaxID=93625 RepID=A0A409VWE9_PSICY|nr:hypothetical protein CVT25_012016 [Psilocybe cyanescens]